MASKSKAATAGKKTPASATNAEASVEVAANCLGVKVPASPFLHEQRIERINAARYEGQEIAGALAVVNEDDTVLEMGAGLGIVGAVVARNAQPKKVASYEANPALIPHIEALYKLNELDKKIEVHNEVLMSQQDRPDEVTFYLRSSFLGSSLVDRDDRPTRPVKIKTADFNAVLRKLRPTVLMIDIEGGELDLLKDADLDGVRAMTIEFHPEAYGVDGMRACKRLLRDAGFAQVREHSSRTVWTITRDN